MRRVAIVGTQGVPANYGGFESLVENMIGENCSPNIQYTVFCSSKDMKEKLSSYKGANLKYVALHANGMQSIPYDIVSMMRVITGYDVILVLGVSGCIFLPLLKILSRKRIVVNIDGLEHRRDKWGKFAKWFLKFSEKVAVKWADTIVADNKGIQNYVMETYDKKAEMIAYGGDHALRDIPVEEQASVLQKYGLQNKKYAISVCRIEPENNCHVSLEAFSKIDKSFVFIGNWKRSEYGKELLDKYKDCPNIQMLDPIYDLDTLYVLRSNAAYYIHGHSAGGTNPSLVEAMFFGCPIIAFDVVYNRESTQNKAYYFSTPYDIVNLLNQGNLDGKIMKDIAEKEYTWKIIANKYEELFRV